MDRLAGPEVDGFTRKLDLLPLAACQMHFNAMPLAVIKCVVLEGVELERAAELAIDALEQVAVELGGNARLVVISGGEHLASLDQIDADDQHGASAEDFCRVAQERRRFIWLEIADGRAGEEAHAR